MGLNWNKPTPPKNGWLHSVDESPTWSNLRLARVMPTVRITSRYLEGTSRCKNFMQPSKAPYAPRLALPPHWQSVGLFAWMASPCHFRCVPPRFELSPCVQPLLLASGPLSNVLQSVHGPAQTRALVRHRLGERRGWPALADNFHTNVWIFLWLNATIHHDRSSIRME